MRRVLALSLALVLALVPVARGGPNDPRDPGNVNRIISVISSPQLAPGEAGEFVFNLTNPYTAPMRNIELNVSIYRYATIDETIPVDGNWGWAYPRIAGSPTPREVLLHRGGPSDRLGVNATDHYIVERFTVQTSKDMPHGSVFAQSAYFVRFWLRFDFNNTTGDNRYVMASKGYFSDTQWEEARNLGPGCTAYNITNRCIGILNLTRLGVDGVLPDSTFGVKEPIPIWPFYGLLALMGFFLVLAFLFWVEENPGRYPRIERRWLTFKGRLRRIARLPRPKKM